MATPGIILSGGPEMAKALEQLDKRVRRKIIVKAVRRAGKPMVKDAKAAARNIGDTKLLAASIGSVVKVYRQQTAFLAIGPRTKFKSKKREKLLGKKANRDPVKYAHLIEFGVQPHTIEGNPFLYIPDYAGGIMRVRSVDHPGFKARPFLRPAFDKHKNGALRAMAAEVALGIRRETRGAK